MRPSLVTFSLVLFLIVGLCPMAGADVIVGEGKVFSGEAKSLGFLVREYVRGLPEESPDALLSDILKHQGANLQTVKVAIRDIPQYGKAPVGGQPRRSITVRGKSASYALYVPPSYSPEQAYPLILCLHGAGFTGEAYLERWVLRLEDRYILACPTIAGGAWWTRFAEEVTLEILDSLSEEYHIDPDRVFLSGMSNGGIGAWIIGIHHAGRFAGIAPMAGGLDDVMFPFVENLVNTPVYVIHGEKDQVMPVRLSRELVEEMKRHGVPYQYREHQWMHPHAGGHFFPRQELPELIAWFDQQRRTSLPRKISLTRDASHLLSFYWVRIDRTEAIAAFSEQLVDKRDALIAEKVYATLDAEIVDPHTIAVHTSRVRRYTIFLNEELVDLSQPISVLTNGVLSFQGLIHSDMAALLQEAKQRSEFQMFFPAKLLVDVFPLEK